MARQCFAATIAFLLSQRTGAHAHPLLCKTTDTPIWESPLTFVVNPGGDQFVASIPIGTHEEPSGAIGLVFREKEIARFRIGDGIYYALKSGAVIRAMKGQPFVDALSLALPWLPPPNFYPHVIVYTGLRNVFGYARVRVTRATCR